MRHLKGIIEQQWVVWAFLGVFMILGLAYISITKLKGAGLLPS